MAGEEAAEGSRRRRHMGLNLYVELPLSRSQVRIDTLVASPTLMMPNSSGGAAPEAPRTGGGAAPEAPRMGEPVALAAVAGEPEKDGSYNCNSSFECNICLDVAKQPVVTSCGHLFCWPCLYRWLYQQATFPECPVCKGEVLSGNITPIYGRGSEEGDSTATASPGLPPRPRANRRESARQHMQRAGHSVTQLESMIMQAIRNQHGIVGRRHPTLAPARTGMTSVNAAPVDPAAPRQSSSVEQLPTSSTAAAMGEPGPSRRSRRTIRPRRRPQ